MKETDLAKKIIIYLENCKWNVYQEVQIGTGGRVVDIVAIQNNISWIIEVKLCLSMKLLEQAFNHRYSANYISIAIPNKNVNKVADMFMKHYGIGGLKLVNEQYEHWQVYEFRAPRLNRKIAHYSNVRRWINDKHKYYAEAGNSMGKRWTPFQETCDQIRNFVQKNPGCTLKDLMSNINHHYHSSISARSSISYWIREGIIKNIYTKKNGKYINLYYEDVVINTLEK